MDVLQTLAECLQDKEELFVQYEVLTEKMNICDPDDIYNYITERSRLANEIDEIDQEILSLIDMYPEPNLLEDALHNVGFYDAYPYELLELYNQSARIYSIVNRIYQQETQVSDRIRSIQADLLGKIKDGLETAKVYKFFKSTYQEPPTGVFFNKMTK